MLTDKLLGTFTVCVDTKGRIVIPKRLRSDQNNGYYARRISEGDFLLYTIEVYRGLIHAIEKLPEDDSLRLDVTDVYEILIETESRISINKLGLGSSVLINGTLTCLRLRRTEKKPKF